MSKKSGAQDGWSWDEPFPVWEEAQSSRVESSDGVTLHVDETGVRDGQAVLFIHGAGLSRLAWDKQMYSDLAAEFRLAAVDLRGHGLSEKPTSNDAYESGRWADDIQAVIDSLDLTNPVLVGWSYGGLVIFDYIDRYGDSQISGINLVASFSKFGVPDSPILPTQEDIPPGVTNAQVFTRRLFYDAPSPRDYYYFLAMTLIAGDNSITDARDHDDLLSGIEIPSSIIYGEQDAVVTETAVKNLAEGIPNARISYYPNIGHMPFWEASKRFNRELQGYVRGAADGDVF